MAAYHAIIPEDAKLELCGGWQENKTRINLQRRTEMDEWQSLFFEHVFRSEFRS